MELYFEKTRNMEINLDVYLESLVFLNTHIEVRGES